MPLMGRIIVPLKIENANDSRASLQCDALVDTGASYLVLPIAWKSRLGELRATRNVELELADQSNLSGEICGPVLIQIEGFPPIYNEVLFIDMKPKNGTYEVLLGYIILEQSQAAVDMVGHRLVYVKQMDLKSVIP